MHFFKKSNKNKTASAAPTPAQTPRTSLDESRPSTGTMTKQQKQAHDAEMLHTLMVKSMAGAMSFFKSSKNQTSSAASTPAQTPRSSIQGQRPKSQQMTREEALEKIMRTAMKDAVNGPFIH
ncbi:hypothetical protein BG004_005788 [Podila humilis]|nr:hypothetical protein BG004_005788 [Podila humilis]